MDPIPDGCRQEKTELCPTVHSIFNFHQRDIVNFLKDFVRRARGTGVVAVLDN